MKLHSFRGKIDLEEFLQEAARFHGNLAPGVVLGGLMVDWALETMAPEKILDALVETRKCLPDAVQILTKCSIGNGWLKILDWGKLAVTLYNKESLTGARVHLDLDKLAPYPRIKSWAMKEQSKKENPLEPLIDDMIAAGRRIFTCEGVRLERIPETVEQYDFPSVCPQCGETFRYGLAGMCEGCRDPFYSKDGTKAI